VGPGQRKRAGSQASTTPTKLNQTTREPARPSPCPDHADLTNCGPSDVLHASRLAWQRLRLAATRKSPALQRASARSPPTKPLPQDATSAETAQPAPFCWLPLQVAIPTGHDVCCSSPRGFAANTLNAPSPDVTRAIGSAGASAPSDAPGTIPWPVRAGRPWRTARAGVKGAW
jgi:hypothetical protein